MMFLVVPQNKLIDLVSFLLHDYASKKINFEKWVFDSLCCVQATQFTFYTYKTNKQNYSYLI
jgi:hypothetical protein